MRHVREEGRILSTEDFVPGAQCQVGGTLLHPPNSNTTISRRNPERVLTHS
jgi:hypothetical protein